jgi:hypothetical protein
MSNFVVLRGDHAGRALAQRDSYATLLRVVAHALCINSGEHRRRAMSSG